MIPALLLAVPWGSLAGAQSPTTADSSSGCQETQTVECRRVTTQTGGDATLIRLESVAATPPDAVEVAWSTGDGNLEVAYEVDSAAGANGSANTSLRGLLLLRLQQLVEFGDQDDDSAFDPGEPVHSWWALSSVATDRTAPADGQRPSNGTVEWQDLRDEPAQAGNATGRRVVAQGLFVAPDSPALPLLPVPVEQVAPGTLQVTIAAFGQQVATDDARAEPSEVLVNWTIQGYPYAHPWSRLALVFDAVAEGRLLDDHPSFDPGDEGLASHVNVLSREALLSLQWQTSADADGADTRVARSVLRQEVHARADGTQTLDATHALSYARSERITHRATAGAGLGADAEILDDGRLPLPSLGVLAALAAGAIGAAFAGRTVRR